MRALARGSVALVLATSLAAAAVGAACGDEPSGADPAEAGAPDGGGPPSPGADSGGPTDPADAANDAETRECVPNDPPPELDGGGHCGAMPLGTAAAFEPVDAGDTDYGGGTLPPGIYDAVMAERLSGNPGSWNETFVVGPENRFTRVRQLDTGGGPGQLVERSGTFTTSANQITFTYDCAYRDGSPVDAGSDTLPYEVVGCDDAVYRYGVTGIRITFKRR
jgi:hypothetical protein